MSSTVIFVGLLDESRSSIARTASNHSVKNLADAQPADAAQTTTTTQGMQSQQDAKNEGVPNAPKSCIGEIFSQDSPDNSAVKNGSSRPRVVRDTPTRPRDTHSRLFGQVSSHHAAPMVTDTIRSNIQFGDSHTNGNGISPSHSPSKQIPNGSAASTPSRASHMKRNPVTGDGVTLPPLRRRHPAASLREGNPITGDGYKSMNGQINTVTSVNGSSYMTHSRVPPGGFSSGLW